MDELVAFAATHLSAREQEVLEHLAEGQTAKQVAHALFIAPRAVERLIEGMRLKMQARNTTHLITCGYLSGALRVA